MAAAARRPAPMARMTVAPPVTMSPPANTPGRLVAWVIGSAATYPRVSSPRPAVLRVTIGLGLVPSATTTVSQASSTRRPVGCGRRRPRSSASPSSISSSSRPRTSPAESVSTSTGLCSQRKPTPSSSACTSSSARAGASARDLRYTQRTVAPNRRATRRQSIAVLPAPTTTTSVPIPTGVSMSGKRSPPIRLTRVRNSLALTTRPAFSPGMPRKLGAPAPVPRNTASNPRGPSRSCTVKVRPTTLSVSMRTPSCSRPSISRSMMSRGRRNEGMP